MSKRFYVALALVVSVMCGVVLAAVNLSGGSSGTSVEVDTTPKAMRAIVYDGAGNAAVGNETWRGVFPINVRQSAATSAGAVVWALYNSNGTKTVLVKKVVIDMFFDGTAAATNMKYEVIKGTGVSTFSGGSTQSPILKRTTYGAATSAVCRLLDTGLTTTGLSAQNTPYYFAAGRVATLTTAPFSHNGFGCALVENFGLNSGEIELANQEVFAIRNNVTSVVGDNIVGYVEVAEK